LQSEEQYQGRYKYIEEENRVEKDDNYCWVEVESKSSGLRYICHRMPISEAPAKDDPQLIEEHLATLSDLEHPHLCKVVESFKYYSSYYVVAEKAHAPPLLDFLADREGGVARVTEKEAAEVVRQILSALSLCHRNNLVHGRLEPDALLLAAPDGGGPKNGRPAQVKIAGAGLGFVLRPPLGQGVSVSDESNNLDKELGSLRCAAPENLQEFKRKLAAAAGEDVADPVPTAGQKLSYISHGAAGMQNAPEQGQVRGRKVRAAVATLMDDPGARTLPERADIWAVGLIAFHLLVGFSPFAGLGNKKQLVDEIVTGGVQFSPLDWKNVSQAAREVVDSMLKLSPKLRPTASELLRNPWLKLVREPVPWPVVRELYRNAALNLKEGQFKKLIIRVIAEQLPAEHPHILNATAAFIALDKDRDGLLSITEFREGLKHFPDLEECIDDVVSLFEAMDRNGSNHLNTQEFRAATLPPFEARDAGNLWQAFRAFDRDDTGIITTNEVLNLAKLLEGSLLAEEQMEELMEVLKEELGCLCVASTPEEVTLVREATTWTKLINPQARRLRPIDFEEFHYLCRLREHHNLCGKVVQKEVYRFVNTSMGMDLYNVRQHTASLPWPPADLKASYTIQSAHQFKGGLAWENPADKAARKTRKAARRSKGGEPQEGAE